MAGMTLSQKILARAAGKDHVAAGELIQAKLDMVLGHDLTAPIAIKEYRKANRGKVFDKDKVALVMDHFVPNKDILAAEQAKMCRCFAKEQDLTHFYDVGTAGVEHVLLPEKGMVTAGDVVVGADSHTCTYGALGAFSTGVGSTDMAAAMATGELWFKVPKAMRFRIVGEPKPFVSGKDVMLYILGQIGVDGCLYQSMEFVGEGLKHLTMDDRLCIANMAIEAGAKNGIFPVDEQTLAFLNAHGAKPPVVLEADADAEYVSELVVDLSTLVPLVAFPHLPSNVKPVGTFEPVVIDQVVIGSCTNGRLSDFVAAAKVLAGRRVHKDVRTLIIPTTQKIYLEMLELGITKQFVEAGCIVSMPTCGPCLGGHMGILAKGERAVATTNRNFVGRMGHPESFVYLANPEVAMASAILGRIASPSELN